MTLFAPFSSLSILPSGGLRVLLRGRSAEAVCDPLPSAPPPPVRPTGSPPAAPLRVRIRRLIRPCPSRSGFGVRGSDAPCGGVVGRPPAEAIPKPHPLATQTRKGVKSRATLNPSSQSGFPLDRRVNSAAGERGRLRSARARNTPPPWSPPAPLTRLLEPGAPAPRFGHGCGGAPLRQLDHRRTQELAHLRA